MKSPEGESKLKENDGLELGGMDVYELDRTIKDVRDFISVYADDGRKYLRPLVAYGTKWLEAAEAELEKRKV